LCVICDSRHNIVFKIVLAHASCVFDIASFGEIGKYLSNNNRVEKLILTIKKSNC